MEWIITIMAIIGAILNIYKSKYGYIIWCFTNGILCVLNFTYGLYSQSALFLVYFVLAIYGFVKWVIDERKLNDKR